MSHRQFFSRVLFCISIILGSIAPSLGMNAPFNVKNDNNAPSRESANSNNQSSQNSYIPLKHFHGEPDSDLPFVQNIYEPNQQKSKLPTNIEQFEKIVIKEAKQVLKSAPPMAKQVVKHLKKKKFLQDESYRLAVFWGPPGPGKTMTAIGIAHKMQIKKGWKLRFFSSGELAQKDRNATAAFLGKIFNEIKAEKDTPCILIIDEMNELLENTGSVHHDTNITANLIWTFLDSQRGNPKFFCIGTMNRIDKLAKPFKERSYRGCIEFLPLATSELKNKIFRKMLTGKHIQIHDDLTNERLDILLQPIADCTGRSLQTIAGRCKSIFRLQDKKSKTIIISDDHITKAVQELLILREVSKYNNIEESDEERQERHHKAQIAQSEANRTLQTEQFNIAQATQRELSEAQLEQQQEQFDQQHRFQINQEKINFGLQAVAAAENDMQRQYNYTRDERLYHKNWYLNNLYDRYYEIFPEQRPANYQRLPQNAAESAKANGQEDSGGCSLQ
jgi:hypothetical protein